VTYKVDRGEGARFRVPDNAALREPEWEWRDGKVLAWKPLTAKLHDSDGAVRTVSANPAEAIEVTGAWDVSFPQGWDAPAQAVFPKLVSWSESRDAGIKYFSGTATYRKSVKCKMESVKWVSADVSSNAPALYRGTLNVPDDVPADTFLDMRDWTKGIVWVNGHNLGRFWSIGPQQTLYLPGCWLRKGGNEVVVLDFFGPRAKSEIASVGKAVLNVLQPETGFNRKERQNKKCLGGEEVASGTFPSGDEAQVVMFGKGVRGNFFTLQALTTYDAKNLATIAEFDFLGKDGNPLNSLDVQITGVDSEEEIREDGVAENAIDGQVEAFWLTSSRTLPHWIEFYVPTKTEVFGFRYTPQQNKSVGRIKDWRFLAR
jgi:hypothetical protein